MMLIVVCFALVSCYAVWRLLLQPKLIMENTQRHFDLTKLLKPTDLSQPARLVYDTDSVEDIRMFDEVAKLLFEKRVNHRDIKFAQQIQYEFLNKMPSRTLCQINQFDLGEWSILWEYRNQSLEYYVSQYGIMYRHTDAQGVEHQSDFIQ